MSTTLAHTYAQPVALAARSSTRWLVRAVGAVQIMFGVAVVALCAAGVDPGESAAVPVLLVTGSGFAVHGIVVSLLAEQIDDSASATLTAVAVDSILALVGIVVLIAGCYRFSASASGLLVAAVAVISLSATGIALTRVHD